jgi:hypothetical protein
MRLPEPEILVDPILDMVGRAVVVNIDGQSGQVSIVPR